MIYVNRSAVVTGGASGIGREVARALAERGAAVAVADINLEGAEQVAAALVQGGAKAEAIACDVSRPEQADAMIARAIEAFGKVDILVHSAGVGVERSFLDTTPEEWQRILDIDLSGTFFCGQAAARHMVERGYGRIVNLASTAGVRGGTGRAAYGTAKGGVIAAHQGDGGRACASRHYRECAGARRDRDRAGGEDALGRDAGRSTAPPFRSIATARRRRPQPRRSSSRARRPATSPATCSRSMAASSRQG